MVDWPSQVYQEAYQKVYQAIQTADSGIARLAKQGAIRHNAIT